MQRRRFRLDDELVRWLRREADRRDTTVPELVRRFLRERMEFELGYEAAMRRYIEGSDTLSETPPPRRSGTPPRRTSRHPRR